MDIQTIKDLITVLGFIVLIWNQNRVSQKDVEEKTTNWAKVNLKLDVVCQSQNDIKDSVRNLEKSTSEADKRLSVLEEMIKVANHRIDDLERGRL